MNIKPQLAKSSNDCSMNLHEKPRFVSRKLDGTRCLISKSGSSSRGGGDYDVVTEHIREYLNKSGLFEKYPDLILDGELYVHGWPLQKISGTCRLKTREERCDKIEYWIYDIVDESKTFSERLDFILFKLSDFITEDYPIKLVEHKLVSGWVNVKRLHDKYVAEGFEGLVSRHPDKVYAAGKRSSDWVKIKDYMEDTFKITGWTPGLRGVEDMCFSLITKDGKPFEAKPIGDREMKEWYVEHQDEWIGKLGEVKFFNYSEEGKPVQTSFRAVRWDLEE